MSSQNIASRIHKLWWQSSYDRGLDVLLFMWPDIIEKFPDAELHISYGWNLFDKAHGSNPERMQWKESVKSLMDQPGIFHYGRIGKNKMEELRKSCGIWAYPTYFTEISCMGALEAQRDGLVPVTMALGALNETVGSGVKIEGDIKSLEVQEKYTSELLKIMGDAKLWEKESQKAKAFAKNYSWENSAKEWEKVFIEPLSNPKVSVITSTVREGFWNVMAADLACQTYKPYEWIIVDDYPEDRSEIASKYAKKYHLNIVYLRGDKALGTYKKKHGLSRANNKGWKHAKGELLVYVQDFVFLPVHGIEDLVTLYRHNPNALLAPTDDYFHCIEPNFKNKEDWFDGSGVFIEKHSWTNIRNTYDGIRKTDNPYDFEMDYCAIPKKIVDHLNGWWEFMDDGEGLGYDNTDIASRALRLGYEIIIDDTNTAKCIDLDPYFPHTTADANKKLYDKIHELDPIRSEE